MGSSDRDSGVVGTVSRGSPRADAGITLLETLVVVAVIGTILAVGLNAFTTLSHEAVLDAETARVRSLLIEARALSLGSKESSSYGVHFEADRGVLFKGLTYDAGDAGNRVELLNSRVAITSIAFSASSEVVFSRLRGNVTTPGSLIISLKNDPSRTRTVAVLSTGIIE